jgi:hypothetical protein
MISSAFSTDARAMIASGSQAANAVDQGANGFLPFADFVASLKQPNAVSRLAPAMATRDAEEMRKYLLKRYDGIKVAHSFMRDRQIFDCMAKADQPALRQNAPLAIAKPPPFLPQGGAPTAIPEAEEEDPFGNLESCAAGTVPIRRVTPEEISRFGTLRRFFSKDQSLSEPKEPNTRGKPALTGMWVGQESEPGSPSPHQDISLFLTYDPVSTAISGTSSHAVSGSADNAASASLMGTVTGNVVNVTENAFYVQKAAPGTRWCAGSGKLTYSVKNGVQTLSGILRSPGCEPASVAMSKVAATHKYATRGQNRPQFGGISVMSVWRPAVYVAAGQVFSLSQQWYTAGSGNGTQTAEVGWQEYPQKYGTLKPVFFSYWTADNYQNTGCYNTDCAAYVQYSNAITPGTAFSHWGLDGSNVYILTTGYYFHDHNWWLSYGNKWIGYYPARLYQGGPMSRHAATLLYGGEAVGAGSWPAMGSGRFAAQRNAAFHKEVAWRDAKGTQHEARLNSPIVSNRACYNDSVNFHGGPGSGSYFFFGGPGGSNC